MSESSRTMKHMVTLMSADMNKYIAELKVNLKAATPIKTGAARADWRQTGKIDLANMNGRKVILTNKVGYASILDGSEGRPTSKQAPDGIVEPALKKTQQK